MLPLFRILLLAVALAASSAQATPTAAPTALVTGANRGLGLEWARQYAARGWHVIATARQPQDATALQQLARRTGRVQIEQLDATDANSVSALSQRLAGHPIDVLVNNVGMLGDEPEQKLRTLDPGRFDTYGTEMNHDAMSPEMRASMTDIESSVGGMIRVLDALTLERSGRWYRFDGTQIDW